MTGTWTVCLKNAGFDFICGILYCILFLFLFSDFEVPPYTVVYHHDSLKPLFRHFLLNKTTHSKSVHIKKLHDPRVLTINRPSNKVCRLQQTACDEYREATKHSEPKSLCQTAVNLSACRIFRGICTDIAGDHHTGCTGTTQQTALISRLQHSIHRGRNNVRYKTHH